MSYSSLKRCQKVIEAGTGDGFEKDLARVSYPSSPEAVSASVLRWRSGNVLAQLSCSPPL